MKGQHMQHVDQGPLHNVPELVTPHPKNQEIKKDADVFSRTTGRQRKKTGNLCACKHSVFEHSPTKRYWGSQHTCPNQGGSNASVRRTLPKQGGGGKEESKKKGRRWVIRALLCQHLDGSKQTSSRVPVQQYVLRTEDIASQ